VGKLHGLSHGFGVAEVVFWPLGEGFTNCPGSFTSCPGEELSAQMIGADAKRILLLHRVGDGIIAAW
jgi:hypothetical protein